MGGSAVRKLHEVSSDEGHTLPLLHPPAWNVNVLDGTQCPHEGQGYIFGLWSQGLEGFGVSGDVMEYICRVSPRPLTDFTYLGEKVSAAFWNLLTFGFSCPFFFD